MSNFGMNLQRRPALTDLWQLVQRVALPWALMTLVGSLSFTGCSVSRHSDPTVDPIVDQITTIAITQVSVIDPVQGLLGERTVIVNGDTIAQVQPADLPLPAVSRVIDGRNKYLIPGLWDFHVHLTYTDDLTQAMPGLFLDYGVTSIRDTGGTLGKLLPVVTSLKEPGADSPRVFFSGPLLDGQQVIYGSTGPQVLGTPVPTAARATQVVAELRALGADFIKIYELVTPPVFDALVQAARELDMPIESHVPLLMLARDAGARVDGIQHLRNIELDCSVNAEQLLTERQAMLANPENLTPFALRNEVRRVQILPAINSYDASRCAETIKALSNTLQVPTLRLNAYVKAPPYGDPGWPAALRRVPEPIQTQWRDFAAERIANPPRRDPRSADWSLFLTGEMYRSGVPFAAGTDTPIGFAIPGFSLHRELQFLVRSGLPALAAIRAATVEPARFFGLDQELGRITPGYGADLLLLNSNPLMDIRNTLDIAAVITRGRLRPPLAMGEH